MSMSSSFLELGKDRNRKNKDRVNIINVPLYMLFRFQFKSHGLPFDEFLRIFLP
jgi:hypothetical protein